MSHVIDCTAIENAAQLHQVLAQALRFPAWYGHNLDALYDCLTDIGEKTDLIFDHWASMGSFSAGFLRVLMDAAEENPNLNITIS